MEEAKVTAKKERLDLLDKDGDGTLDDPKAAKDPMVRELVIKLEQIGLQVLAQPSLNTKNFFIQCSVSPDRVLVRSFARP